MRRFPLTPVVAIAVLAIGPILAPSPAVAQETGVVTGQVTDADTGQPVSGAQILVVGTDIGGIANQEGRFRIEGVPAGPQRIRAMILGYTDGQRSVTVTAGQRTEVDFALEQSALELDEIVVTATGEQRRRELGNAVAKVNASEVVETAPISNFQELLTGRAAGVNILPANGTVGTGARIRIRGLSSTSLDNDPLIYIDGVRVETSAPPMTSNTGVGGGEPSFFDQINPEEIESIEIVKGPSAATLYGTQAANGVIRITTKRGAAGPPRFNLYGEVGTLTDPTDYPGLYYSAGRAVGTGAPRLCLPYQEVLGACTIDQLHVRNLMHEPETSPLQTGRRYQVGGQVSGGNPSTRYFVSGEYEYQLGTLTMPESSRELLREERGTEFIPDDQLNPNYQRKLNARANLNIELAPEAELSISTGYVGSHLQLPQTGDNLEGIYGTALFGTANPAAASPWGFAPPDQGFAHEVWRETDRFLNSTNLVFRPVDFLTARATLGLDYTNYNNNSFVATGQGCAICGQDRQGTRTIDRFTNFRYSVDLNASADFRLTDDITSKTSAGAQWHRDLLEATFNEAFIFPPGGQTIDAGSVKTSGEETTEAITLGTYVEQQFGWRDKLFVTGAVRIDENSAFGQDYEAAVYPKASISFLAIEDAGAALINSLRFRGAYGASGLQPQSTDAIRFFAPATSSVFVGGSATDRPGVILGGLGNQDLQPERSNEYEVGFDLAMLENRVSADFTYYHKSTVDALVERALPGSLGAVDARIENIGEVVNQGFELGIDAQVLEGETVSWDLGLQGSTNDNELITLGEGVPPIVGFGFMNRPGYPLFGHWWQGLESWSDADGNGIITPDEVVVSDTLVFGGSSVPTRQLSLNTTVRLWDRVRVYGMAEYRGGFVSHNVNNLFQCAFVQNCRALNDPTASLEEQAKAVAGPRAFGAYWEDASFLKFREASVSVTLPEGWLARFGARSATLTLTGRNLGTITGFNSWDPELNTSGVTDGPNYNFVEAAQLRTFLLRLGLGF